MKTSDEQRVNKAVNARVIQRETHSSRAVVASILALIGIALVAYLVAETIAALTGSKSLLVSASELWHGIWHAPTVLPQWVMVVAGVVSILIALFLLFKAVAPGSLNRHQIHSDRMAMVVDDAVIAASVSKAVRDEFALDASQVSTSVDKRHVRVTVTPSSGIDMDYGQMERFVAQLVAQYKLQPNVSASLKRADGGVIAG